MSWITDSIENSVADYLFNIKIELPNRTLFQRDVRPDVAIDFDDLEKQLVELPEQLVFFDMILAEQRAKVATIEARKEATRGDLTAEIQEKARLNGIKLSVQTMKEIAQADDRMIEIESKIINETRKEHKIRALVNALQRKSEHLRSLAGFKREENKQS